MSIPYPAAFEHLLLGGLGDLTTDPLRLMLAADSYAPADTDAYADVPALYEAYGPGYVTGGPELTGRHLQPTDGGRLLACDPVTFPDTGVTARWAIVYRPTATLGTSPLICRIDLGQSIEPDGADLTVTFTAGLLLVGETAMTVRTITIAETVAPADQVTARRAIVVDAGPPAGIGMTAFDVTVLDAEILLVAPVEVSVPGGRPTFTVTVDTPTPGLSAQIQWATDPAFTAPAGTVTVGAPTGDAITQVSVQAATELPDAVWWWRARITGGAWPPGPWTAPARFAAIAEEGHALMEGSWQTTTGTRAAAHLWHIDAATGSQAGQSGVLIGAGFGTAPQVLFGDTACTVLDVVDVPASGGGRRIQPGVVCEPWHQRIVFVIPPLDPDDVGAAVSVVGGD